MAKEAMKLVANNKKAYHDYFIEEKYEAGLALHGTEVKVTLSIRSLPRHHPRHSHQRLRHPAAQSCPNRH